MPSLPYGYRKLGYGVLRQIRSGASSCGCAIVSNRYSDGSHVANQAVQMSCAVEVCVGLPDWQRLLPSLSTRRSGDYPAPPEVCPSEEDLAQLADLLNKHTRITLFCGIGCRGAHEEVIALSEKLNAPVVYTFKGKMEVQYENPYEVGMTGLLGMPSGILQYA